MGRNEHSPELIGVFAQKDAKITHLEAQLAIYAARTSDLRCRLLATLDAMDELRADHARELALERRVKEKLSAKLDRYLDELKRAEAQRDEMMEITNIIQEKVDISNDFSVWPCARLRLTSPIDPLEHEPSVSPEIQPSAASLAQCSAAVMASLRLDLEAERRAHAQTRDIAERQTLTLTAQLARRDAELEACNLHVDHAELVPPPSDLLAVSRARMRPRKAQKAAAVVVTFSREEAIDVLEMTAAKNRALEVEVKGLVETLEKARQAAGAPKATTRSGVSDASRRRDAADGSSPAPSSTPTVRPASHPESPPISPAREQPLSAAVPPNAADTSNTPRPQGGPLSAPSSSIPALRPSYTANFQGVGAATHRSCASHREGDGQPPTAPMSHAELGPLQQLEQQVGALSAEIDRFKAERDLLKAVLADRREIPKSEGSCSRAFQESESARGSHIEEEYMRLVHSQDALRQELEALQESSRRREEELEKQIHTLQRALLSTSPEHSVTLAAAPQGSTPQFEAEKSPEEPPVPALMDIMDEDANEKSMELATPLQPTIILQPETIPQMPEEHPASPPASPPQSVSPPSSVHTDLVPPSDESYDPAVRLGAIEEELALARFELEQRDQSLAELRDVVGLLREMVESSTEQESTDGPGDGLPEDRNDEQG